MVGRLPSFREDLFSVAFAVSFREGISLLWYCFFFYHFCLCCGRSEVGGDFPYLIPISWMMIVGWLVMTVGDLLSVSDSHLWNVYVFERSKSRVGRGFKYYFDPDPTGNDPTWLKYVSIGLVQPPTSRAVALSTKNIYDTSFLEEKNNQGLVTYLESEALGCPKLSGSYNFNASLDIQTPPEKVFGPQKQK